MQERSRWVPQRIGLVLAAIAVFGVVFASVASANNLDRNTAQGAAKEVAKKECQNTNGCYAYGQRNLKKLSNHKAQGKIFLNINMSDGTQQQCRRRVILKLDHFSGQINYALGARRCVLLTP